MADSPLTARVNAEITAAMKAQQAGRLGTLRLVKAAIMNRGVEKNRDLDDAEVVQVIAQLVKQRRDSIEQFAAAGRQDLVAKETAELAILEEYQPPAASADEIGTAVAEAVVETGATSPKDMGKVMKAVMTRLAGKTADGKVISEAVKTRLASL